MSNVDGRQTTLVLLRSDSPIVVAEANGTESPIVAITLCGA